MRAACSFGDEDLRVLEVADPVPGAGRGRGPDRGGHHLRDRREDVAPRPSAARRRYPAPLRPRDGGVREDTGERVLVGDSVACGDLPRLRRRAAADLPRAALGVRRLRRDDGGAGGRAARGPGRARARRAPRWPSRSPPPSTRSSRAPAKQVAPDAGVLGGGPMGQMLAALLVAEGRTVTLADRHAERRAQAEAAGAMSSGDAGRPRRRVRGRRAGPTHGAPRSRRARPAAASCSSAAARPAPTPASRPARSTTRSSTSAARSTTRPPRSTARWRCWPTERVDWRALAAGPIGLGDLEQALATSNDGPARKWIVIP